MGPLLNEVPVGARIIRGVFEDFQQFLRLFAITEGSEWDCKTWFPQHFSPCHGEGRIHGRIRIQQRLGKFGPDLRGQGRLVFGQLGADGLILLFPEAWQVVADPVIHPRAYRKSPELHDHPAGHRLCEIRRHAGQAHQFNAGLFFLCRGHQIPPLPGRAGEHPHEELELIRHQVIDRLGSRTVAEEMRRRSPPGRADRGHDLQLRVFRHMNHLSRQFLNFPDQSLSV